MTRLGAIDEKIAYLRRGPYLIANQRPVFGMMR